MKFSFLVLVVLVAACGTSAVDEHETTSTQALFDCSSPTQRLACAPPADPSERFICHATSSKADPYVKLSVGLKSAHRPGVAHGNHVPDQAPGASASDLRAAVGLDCECEYRVCQGTCTGSEQGAECDDGSLCTGNGMCNGDVCDLGAPLPPGTTCGGELVCNGDGSCVDIAHVVINEVESNGGVPGDWIELVNAGTTVADVSGWSVIDNDNTHTAYVLPIGTTIPVGGYLVVEEAQLGFGLGGADSARLFDATNAIVDTFAWTAHAVTTYGRCPNVTGAFRTVTTSTKGADNDCSLALAINEIESNGGVPGDWVELYNAGPIAIDLSGWVFKDNDDTHAYVLPVGTTIAAGAYLVLDEAQFGFGLGGADSARIFDASAVLINSHSWTAHAVITYARCPNGTGSFGQAAVSTKGTANDCSVAVRINEIESNGGIPGDWVELFNADPVARDLSGWIFKDNDDTHAFVLPAGTTIAAGGYLVLDEAQFGFGLGGADSARIFDGGGTLIDSHAWTAHAVITYARCPNGSGPFGQAPVSTKGTANDCSAPLRINEIESNGGVPGDWVELFNAGPVALDLTGWIFKDADDTHAFVLPAGSTIAAGGYLVLDEAAFGFGLGAADSARIFDAGSTLIDSHAWTAHAAVTIERCPNGTGAFSASATSTKGAANSCGSTTPPAQPWPGQNMVTTADTLNPIGGNGSGLFYDGSSLWAARNGPGQLLRLEQSGGLWTPAQTWDLRYPDGTGDPDAEDVTKAELGSTAFYVATERNNAVSGVSRMSILRFDTSATGTINATHEWNLTADLPVAGPNVGLEAITWIPDSFLVANTWFDPSKGHAYNPAEYPNHGTGIFFVGVEQSGDLHAYALDHTSGGFSRLATFASGDVTSKALSFDRDTGYLWSFCGASCGQQASVWTITLGVLTRRRQFAGPSTMPNLANEGIAIAPESQCSAGFKSFWWIDDGETGGHAIRRDTIPCGAFVP